MDAIKLTPDALNVMLILPQCSELIEQRIGEIRLKWLEVSGPLKRSAWDVLSEMGMLNAKDLIDEFRWIIVKESELPKRERDFIQQIVSSALVGTYKFMQEMVKVEELNQAIAVKKGRKPKKVK